MKALLLALLLSPAQQTRLGAMLAGRGDLARELVSVCKRESSCRWVRVHRGDVWAGALAKAKALRVGWLSPWCPWTWLPAREYAVRGSHGLMAAYSMRFLGCLPPHVLDIPLVSAFVAAKRATNQCERYGACDRSSRYAMAKGAWR